ncbi:hypothetical protein MFUL124B02_28875 [Myxococcus fulvus 124B02]|nr:hypothetical protein MFUL124B02_28875 [Myxococcus fulvus 124B02]
MAALPVVLLTSLSLLLGASGGDVEATQVASAQTGDVEAVALCTDNSMVRYYNSTYTMLMGYVSCACGREPIYWGRPTPYELVELGQACGGGSTGFAPELNAEE